MSEKNTVSFLRFDAISTLRSVSTASCGCRSSRASALDRVGQSPEAVELQLEQVSRVVERLLGTMGMMGFWGLGHWRRGLVPD